MKKNYIVEVQTGNRNYAGTDADVYIQLYGEKGTSPELYLDNSEDNFEKGKHDVFNNISTEDVGWINKIRVFHDNSGRNSGWFLNNIKITDPSNGLTWQAEYNRWLATDEGDRAIDVTTEVPIGNVTLAEGVIKKLYMGFEAASYVNQGPSDFDFKHTFAHSYKKGVSIDTTTALTVKLGVSLGASFFGLVDSKFSTEVQTSISKKVGTSSEETLEWKNEYSYKVPAGKSITVVEAYFQNMTEGKVYAGGVSLDYEAKFNISNSMFVFPEILNDQQVTELLSQIIGNTIGMPASLFVFKTAPITLTQKKLTIITKEKIYEAMKSFPVVKQPRLVRPQRIDPRFGTIESIEFARPISRRSDRIRNPK